MISISYETARVLLANFTDARDVDRPYWFGLPLNTSSNATVGDYRATVDVHRSSDKTVTLHNIHATIQGTAVVILKTKC